MFNLLLGAFDIAKPSDVRARIVADNTDVDFELFAQGDAGFAGDDGPTDRKTASAWELLIRSMGGPKEVAGKVGRLAYAVYLTVNVAETNRRLRRLAERGFAEQIPTHAQLIFGGLDMLRFFIKPGAESYYASQGINNGLHYILRIFDDPASMIDPLGIRSPRDTIIGHVLQVVHANPVYDFQLLEMFEDGMDDMEKQTRQMLDGTHPRYASISAIVEDPDYHRRLLDYIERYKADPRTPQLIRQTGAARSSPDFVLAEMTFGTLPSFLRYANRLPRSLPALLRHNRTAKSIRPEHCDPEIVEAHRRLFAEHHLAEAG